MRVQISILLILTGCALSFSCATTQSPHAASKKGAQAVPHKKDAPLAKAGQKTPAPAVAQAQGPSELDAIYLRLNDTSMQLSDEDVRTATALHPAAKNSLEEAILVTTQLRLLKLQVDQSSGFQSNDLYATPGEQSASSSPSMEKLFQDLQIDLPATYRNNSHLKNKASLTLAQDLIDRTKNSAPFTAQLHASLDEESQHLAATAPAAAPASPNAGTNPLGPSSDVQTAAQTAPVPPTPDHATDKASATVVPGNAEGQIAVAPSAPNVPGNEVHQIPTAEVKTGPTDLKRTDALLMQAQKMADKGEFKQAIESVGRIDTQDPFYEQAREKIRVYSNRAVQDLRQKAALAFQNALPLSDSQAKQAYLVQARSLLEKALQEYPGADQLDTVKENLAVIARDLDSIAKDTSAADSTPKSQ